MTAVTNPNPVYLHPAVQADALAEALNQLGFTTAVMKQRVYHPCVVVKCGAGRHVRQTEYIYVAPEPNSDGEWWFWRASPDDVLVMEKIAPISQVSATADLLARAIPQVRE